MSYRREREAEGRAVQPGRTTIDRRLEDLERRGALVGSRRARRPLKPVANRPGALKRFLAERED